MTGQRPGPATTMIKCNRDHTDQILDLNILNKIAVIGPLNSRHAVIRWIYIEKESFDAIPMQNFEVKSLYIWKENIVKIQDHDDLMLSERDSFMFGFLLKFAFYLKLMCISDIFKGKDRKYYQVGYLCVKIRNIMVEEDIALLCKKRGYRVSFFDNYPW